MNIVLTTISLDSRRGGGTAERTRRLAEHLHRQGHRCTVASMEGGDLAEVLRRGGVAVHVSGAVRLRYQIPFLDPLRLLALVREADAVHILGYWNVLSVATALLATRLGKPYALSAAGEFVGLDRPGPVKRIFHRLFGRRMIRGAGMLVAITALEREQIIERFGLAEDRVVVVPNGVEELPAAERDDASPREPVVLFVGRLAEVKGPDLLVEAFAEIAGEHPDAALVIAGPDFGMKPRLVSLVEKLGIADRVRFTGHLDEAQRNGWYRRALFLAVPSRAEAMSLVALEAGILGTPVLLTDRCGFDEAAGIGGGEIVPASVEGLSRGLRAMLGQRSSLPLAGQRLRSHIARKYTWPAIAKALATHLEEAQARVARRSAGSMPSTGLPGKTIRVVRRW